MRDDFPLLTSPRAPRHLEVARALSERILSGGWPVGTTLPNEAGLGREFGISRYRVRQAVQVLTDLGLVSRKQGVGTRVLSAETRARYTQKVDGLEDIIQYVKGTSMRVLKRERLVPRGALQELLASEPAESWLRLLGVRTAPGHRLPIAVSRVYVKGRYSRLDGIGKTLTGPVYALIEQQHRIRVTRVEQEIFATAIGRQDAHLLRVARGSPGLRIVRKYRVGDEIIDVTEGIHPAERFSYSMAFDLDRPGGRAGGAG